MKNILLTLVMSTLIVSCGLSPEEQKALQALESREFSLKSDLEAEQFSKDFWYGEFEKESDVNLKAAYASEYRIAENKFKMVQAELTEVQFQISQIK